MSNNNSREVFFSYKGRNFLGDTFYSVLDAVDLADALQYLNGLQATVYEKKMAIAEYRDVFLSGEVSQEKAKKIFMDCVDSGMTAHYTEDCLY